MTAPGNPSALVAAEGALAAQARVRGPGAAFAAAATGDAAHAWLKSHDAAAQLAQRHVATIWMACDGSAGVSSGTAGGSRFATVWKRQKKGDYKWVLTAAAPRGPDDEAADWVTGKLADCPPRPMRDADDRPRDAKAPRPLPGALPPADPGMIDGRSDDGSLAWRSDGDARRLVLWMWRDGAFAPVLDLGAAR